jgi:hypothetical protein
MINYLSLQLFRIVNGEKIEYNKILVSSVLYERESTKILMDEEGS